MCESPQINDPDDITQCCNPDANDNTICAVGKSFFTFTDEKLPYRF